jgi:hypothetical protein
MPERSISAANPGPEIFEAGTKAGTADETRKGTVGHIRTTDQGIGHGPRRTVIKEKRKSSASAASFYPAILVQTRCQVVTDQSSFGNFNAKRRSQLRRFSVSAPSRVRLVYELRGQFREPGCSMNAPGKGPGLVADNRIAIISALPTIRPPGSRGAAFKAKAA